MNLNTTKLEELLATLKKKEEEKDKNTVLWVLAIIGAVAAVAGIAFAVYRFFAPDYLEDFEEDFDDDFDDYSRMRKSKNFHCRGCFEQIRMAVCYV